MNDFKLPDIWYIIVTEENVDVLSKWRWGGTEHSNSKLSLNYITGMCSWGGPYPKITKEHNSSIITKDSSFNFGEEITFNQFRKYVLNEDIEDEIEIINEDLDYLVELFKELKIE